MEDFVTQLSHFSSEFVSAVLAICIGLILSWIQVELEEAHRDSIHWEWDHLGRLQTAEGISDCIGCGGDGEIQF